MTVTEALAEIKLIQKKVDKKIAAMNPCITRFEHQKDPYPDSAVMIRGEVQSIEDLYTNLSSIRKAISKANLETTMTVGTTEKTVTEWLTWKKEIYDPLNKIYSGLVSTATNEISRNAKQPSLVTKTDSNDATQLAKLVINVDIPTLNKKMEQIMEINEKVDGLLSLKNATVVIEY